MDCDTVEVRVSDNDCFLQHPVEDWGHVGVRRSARYHALLNAMY